MTVSHAVVGLVRAVNWRLAGSVVSALLIVAVASLAVYTRIAWPPPVDPDTLREAARAFDARIVRDAWGVPHISAPTDAGVAFGLGYAQAEDDWQTLQRVVLMARGDLARHRGKSAATGDYLVKLFRVEETVTARYQQDLSPAMRAVLDGYAAGLNLWAVDHPDQVDPGVLPITGQDVVAGFVFRTPFFFGMEAALTDLYAGGGQSAVSAGAATDAIEGVRQAGRFLRGGVPAAALGSNAIALAPDRSTDGHTRLLVNSHQPYEGPVAWYEARWLSDEGWDATGATFPGSPVMLHGANRHLGWAHTVNKPDLIDTFKLVVDDPDNPRRIRFDGQWRPLMSRDITLEVRLIPGFAWPVTRTIYWSPAHDAPVIKAADGYYAIRHAGMGTVGQVQQWYAMNKATSLETWMDAMRQNHIASFNTVYADKTGRIAFVYNVRVPDRSEGWNWRETLPGDLSSVAWQRVRGFDAVPRLIEPGSGYLVSANHTPLEVTDAPDNLVAEAFDPTLSIERGMTNRALRAKALYGGNGTLSRDEFLARKYDTRYAPGSAPVRLVVSLLNDHVPDSAQNAEKRWVLEHWNATADADSTSAPLVLLTALKALDSPSGNGRIIRDPAEALDDAAQSLRRHYGRLDVPWGEIMRLKRGDVDAALNGGPDTLRAIYGGATLNADGELTAGVGDSYILLADWDRQGRLRVDTVHQYGSAVQDRTSPFYDDQARLFAKQQLKRMPLDLRDVLQTATADYRPGIRRRSGQSNTVRGK